MKVKISCGSCSPKSSFLYQGSDGFEIEELPGDFEYYAGTLATAIRKYGHEPLGSMNLPILREITVIIFNYLEDHSFNQNQELRDLLRNLARDIIAAIDGQAELAPFKIQMVLDDILDSLDALLYSF